MNSRTVIEGLALPEEGSRKVLFAASTGGHLAQLVRFSKRWKVTDDSLWISFDSPQSRSLLEGKRVLYVPYVQPRDVVGTLRSGRVVAEVLKAERFDIAVSTGAALALGVLPVARRHGVPSFYIESVSRVNGPSLTGRLLHASRLTGLRTQHPSWARGRWLAHPSVLSQFSSTVRRVTPSGSPRLFITLGTIKPYRFDSLVDSLLSTGLANDRTVWQLGETMRDDLPGSVYSHTSAVDFERFANEADVVVTHAGVGTILNLLEWGIYPVVVPRRRSRNEHVDDHQTQIAELVSRLDVALSTEAPELATADILAAAARRNVETAPVAPNTM